MNAYNEEVNFVELMAKCICKLKGGRGRGEREREREGAEEKTC
jgi:hypothetical protein